VGADVDAFCGARCGEHSPERSNRRDGYSERNWDTRVGSLELAMPKLREGSYFPDWLLQARRRAEQASVSVIADAHLAGVSRVGSRTGAAARRRADLEEPVSRLAKSLDQIVEDFRTGRRRRPVCVRHLRRAPGQVPEGQPHGQRLRHPRRRRQPGRLSAVARPRCRHLQSEALGKTKPADRRALSSCSQETVKFRDRNGLMENIDDPQRIARARSGDATRRASGVAVRRANSGAATPVNKCTRP
jgi:hypothetical protein